MKEIIPSHPDLGSLYVQMGEVLQGLRLLADAIEVRHAQSERLQDVIRADVALLRHDQKDLEEKLDCVICVMQHDLETLRTGSSARGLAVDEVLRMVNELRAPVAEIVALRSRVAGVLLAFGMVGSVLVWLAEPLYRWAIEQHYLKS